MKPVERTLNHHQHIMSTEGDVYTNLDPEDESLAHWKASLGIPPDTGPQIMILTFEIVSEALPADKTLKKKFTDPADVEFIIKEGIEYNIRITFKVNHGISSGFRYSQSMSRLGFTDKKKQMIGTYAAHTHGSQHVYTKDLDTDKAPSGALVRGPYLVHSIIDDEDGHSFADFFWKLVIRKNWP